MEKKEQPGWGKSNGAAQAEMKEQIYKDAGELEWVVSPSE